MKDAQVSQSESAIYQLEKAITGPTPTGLTCANSDCSAVKHCRKTLVFAGTCQLKQGYVNDLVRVIDGYLDGFLASPPISKPLYETPELQEIPVADILLDLTKSQNVYDILHHNSYVNQLAVLYFVARVKNTGIFHKNRVKETLAQAVPFATKAAELRSLSDAILTNTPQSAYLTKRNMLIAGAAIAVAVAAGAAWHYSGGRVSPEHRPAKRPILIHKPIIPEGINKVEYTAELRDHIEDATDEYTRMHPKQQKAFLDHLYNLLKGEVREGVADYKLTRDPATLLEFEATQRMDS